MFTGIIERTGEIVSIENKSNLIHFWVKTDIVNEVKIDQSISHNGICLTVDAINEDLYRVTAISETINKTNISNWTQGDILNIERCLKLGDRLDGHIVQGHVDSTVSCVDFTKENELIEYEFCLNESFNNMIVEKGSVCLDGISLTCHSLVDNRFKVSIIPYTYNNTNVQFWDKGTLCNIEFDILGKYINRNIQLNN